MNSEWSSLSKKKQRREVSQLVGQKQVMNH